ncbi:prolyl oligopeptidase family serine peptidase [Candidatus Palauibacter sp.]|uniref:alpha/beta hydrolase family protein n=1 Tax=Candidatus Palauibacter sp. TaxID=3101350 RepID=UPI003C6F3983
MNRSHPPPRTSRLFLSALHATALASALCARPAFAQSLDDWLSVSRVGEFVWSADGDAFYYTSNAHDSGTLAIFRVASDGGVPEGLAWPPEGARPEPAQSLGMSPGGDELVFVSARYYQGYDNLWRIPIAPSGAAPTPITFNDAVIETAPTLSADGRTLAYQVRTPAGPRIFLRDLADSRAWPRLFTPGDANETSPRFSPDGRSIAFSSGGDIRIRAVGGTESRVIVDPAIGGGNGGFAWSPDGTRLAFTNGRSGWAQVAIVRIETGDVTPITYDEREHGGISWSPDGRWLVFTRSDASGFSNQVVVAPSDGTGAARAITDGKGRRSQPRFSPDGDELAWLEQSDTRTPDIWKTAWNDGEWGERPVQVTNSMGRIDPERLSEAEEVYYPGPDNLPIPTLLYRPRDFDPSRTYPVIVRLHGHPGQWNHSFEMMRQYWVQRGFVVAAPNPRGSRGFGQGFHDLHIADYGGVEFQDVMNVLPFLEGLGYVDMTRKATWGGSGGGYMSLVIATEAPDAFQAQVIRAPVSEWRLLANDRFAASGRHWTASRTPRRERSEFGGPYDEIPEEYEERSPVNFVDNVRVPQLLLQGLRDAAVPPRQSQVWAERMREAGKGDLLSYIEYPDEDHSLRRYKATVRDILERMDALFARHLRLNTESAP